MPKTTTTNKFTQNHEYKFVITGNVGDALVKKINENYGDGEIGTGSGGYVKTDVKAKISFADNYNKVKVSITYEVREDDFGKKKNDDGLIMSDDFYYDISALTQGSAGTRVEGNKQIKTTSEISFGGNYKDAHYTATVDTSKEKHSLLDLNWRTANNNGVQRWIPSDDILVKIDGKGKENEKVGNLRIEGKILFTIVRKDTVVTTTMVEEQTVDSQMRVGSGKVLDTISPVISEVLGCGYDITGGFARVSSSKRPVLNLSLLNRYRHILSKTSNKTSEIFCEDGESLEEMSSKLTKSLSVKVAAHAGGAAFSNETKESFSEERTSKEVCKYSRKDFKFVYESHQIDDAYEPKYLDAFVARSFLEDLDRMSNPEQFIKQYGTHVVLGMEIGGRLTYNMRYKESVISRSTAKSFENTTKVSFDSNGIPTSTDTSSTSNVLNKLYGQLNAASNPKDIASIADSISKVQGIQSKESSGNKSAGGSGSSSGGNNSGFGGSVEVTVSQTENRTFKSEDKSTEIACYTAGGDSAMIGSYISDASKYEKWGETVKDNQTFIGFIPGTIIPIEEFVPESGHRLTKNMIKVASESHQQDAMENISQPEERVYNRAFNTLSKNNTMEKNEQDAEIDSSKGKITAWRAHLELIHLHDGSAGCTMALTVYEDGESAGKTVLQNTHKIVFDKENYSLLELKAKICQYTVSGTVYGQYHDWIDVTDKFRRCEFIDTKDNRVYIKIDGKGDDLGNIGIKGQLKVNYKCYK